MKDPGTAIVLEILLGLLGFLGIGYLYAGYTTEGILRLIGWWIALGIGAVLVVVTFGIGSLCLIPVMIAVPILSGLALKKRMQGGHYW